VNRDRLAKRQWIAIGVMMALYAAAVLWLLFHEP
jgi:hypothetical protein